MINSYITMLRPHQWLKNLLLFFPPFFGGTISSAHVLSREFIALFAFCAAASAGYIINDIRDRAADRNHDKKRKRAIARGEIPIAAALISAIILLAFALAASLFVNGQFWLYVIAYLLISTSYTLLLKEIVILDIFAISLGFLVRVLAGGEASGVTVSNWLFLSVFLIALFLAAGKRMGELVSMGKDAPKHRKSLAAYSPSFLDGVLWFSASAALVTYSLYTIEQKSGLFYTVPLVAFGLLRYIYIAKKGKGDPTEALLKDPQIMSTGIIWATIIAAIIYR